MRIKNIVFEDFVNYKKCSMFIGTSVCNWKCCIECGEDLCQNMDLAKASTINISDKALIQHYLQNPLTHAIVFGGLEPIDQINELDAFITLLRQSTNDDVVIYTGYKEEEIAEQIKILQKHSNILVKFGRFVPYDEQTYDKNLGVYLASKNQYSRWIS